MKVVIASLTSGKPLLTTKLIPTNFLHKIEILFQHNRVGEIALIVST